MRFKTVRPPTMKSGPLYIIRLLLSIVWWEVYTVPLQRLNSPLAVAYFTFSNDLPSLYSESK